MTALDLKRFETSKYRTYRVLSAPGRWAEMYRSRIKAYGNHRGVIIFPETILGLTSKYVSVRRMGVPSSGSGPQSSSIEFSNHLPILIAGGEEITTLDDLLDIEHSMTPDDLRINSRGYGHDQKFFDTQRVLFRSSDNAARYVEKTIGSELKRYFG